VLHEGSEIPFVIARGGEAGARAGSGRTPHALPARSSGTALRFWQTWIAKSKYQGRWRETVKRSALALKLMTFAPTGAIVAAPTTSLPERIGGDRNWDYRYTWLRDSAFTVYAFLRVGLSSEAEAFMGFLERVSKDAEKSDGPNVLYGIDGRRDVAERCSSTWRVTAAPRPSGWATARPGSSSSTSRAS
jgi:GH15 family glucan-1,4-alpha-glucosidase